MKIPIGLRTKILVFIGFATLMSIVISIVDYTDSVRPEAERFLVAAPEVNSRVGKVLSFSLQDRIRVAASKSEPPYRKYSFYVRGDKSSAQITVRVDDLNGQRRFSVVPY